MRGVPASLALRDSGGLGTGPGGRSALRADCAAMLAPGSRRRTRFAHLRFAALRQAAASMRTMRASRADPDAALLAALHGPAPWPPLPREPGQSSALRPVCTLRNQPSAGVPARRRGGWGGPVAHVGVAEERRASGLRAKRASSSDSPPVSERSERSERSEFGGGARSPSTAGQSARRADRPRRATPARPIRRGAQSAARDPHCPLFRPASKTPQRPTTLA